VFLLFFEPLWWSFVLILILIPPLNPAAAGFLPLLKEGGELEMNETQFYQNVQFIQLFKP